MKFLLLGLEAYNAKDYTGMQRYHHAAMQKLTEQAAASIKANGPREAAKIALLRWQIKAIRNQEFLTKLLGKISGCGDKKGGKHGKGKK